MSLKEDDYKADFEIAERYIGFSSELLRISLLAIGGYGAMIMYALEHDALDVVKNAFGFLVSSLMFALSAGVTLAHRFFATDSLSYRVGFLRAKYANDEKRAQKERTGLRQKLKQSERFLIAAEWLFGFGVLFFVLGLLQLLGYDLSLGNKTKPQNNIVEVSATTDTAAVYMAYARMIDSLRKGSIDYFNGAHPDSEVAARRWALTYKYRTDTTIKNTRYVLTVAWKPVDTLYGRRYDNKLKLWYVQAGNQMFKYPIYVTRAPDLSVWYYKDQCHKLSKEQLDLRIKQRLGLPPHRNYYYFIECWVKEEDLFRPAAEADAITWPAAGFKPDTGYVHSLTAYLGDSYKDTVASNCYPFTAMGYTYDWCADNPNHIGAAEYMVKPGKQLYVRRVLTTADYFKAY